MNAEKIVNFSIIIPHKNIPDLLIRCLESIPSRDDIQIIVVDDNSDLIDFERFPGLNKPYIETYFTKEGKGAGYARNIGLSKVKGKWILFADADDFFNKNAFDVLDEYINSPQDLLIFGMNSVFSDDLLKQAGREGTLNHDIDLAIKGDKKAFEKVRYTFLSPGSKLYRSSLILNKKLQFDEISASNDTMFCIEAAFLCTNIIFNRFCLYCITYRNNSLVTSYTYEYLNCRFKVSFRLYKYLRERNKEEYSQSPVEHWLQFRHCSYFIFILKFFELIYFFPIRIVLNHLYRKICK